MHNDGKNPLENLALVVITIQCLCAQYHLVCNVVMNNTMIGGTEIPLTGKNLKIFHAKKKWFMCSKSLAFDL